MNCIINILVFAACSALAVPLSEIDAVSTSRIANGIISTNNQFPYAVSLQANDAASQALPTRGHRCGGVLITLQHALTVASCLYDISSNGSAILINPANFQIFGGGVTLDTLANHTRPIANFTIHPSYIGAPAYLNDIAIVTLRTPFNATNVTPLSLPSASWEPTEYQQCTIAGWGATGPGANAQTSPTQRYANKYIYKQERCMNIYGGIADRPNVFPSMVCAASYNILSIGCRGDSGNALVCNETLTGLLFYHNNCLGTSYPELYTRVSNYTTWVRSVTGSGNIFTPTASIILFFSMVQIILVKIAS